MKNLRPWLTLPIALLIVLAIAAPVSAGPVSAVPDAQVRRAGGQRLGNNIYNLDGAGQTVGGHKARRYRIGAVRWFYVYAFNDGVTSDSYGIKGTATFTAELGVANLAPAPFQIQYYSPSGADITEAVWLGTFQTPAVAPGGRYGIKVKVTVRPEAYHGFGVELLATVTSVNQPLEMDAVGIRMRRK